MDVITSIKTLLVELGGGNLIRSFQNRTGEEKNVERSLDNGFGEFCYKGEQR